MKQNVRNLKIFIATIVGKKGKTKMKFLSQEIKLNEWQKNYLINWIIGAFVLLILGNAIYYDRFWELMGIIIGVPVLGWISKMVFKALRAAYRDVKEEFED
jgi:uncharacterized membrane protein YeaQ/YmgE (transglycosylase-associated protein family)